jgi:hypothetical protein
MSKIFIGHSQYTGMKACNTQVPNLFIKLNLLIQICDLELFYADVGMPPTDGTLADSTQIDPIKKGISKRHIEQLELPM